MGLQGQTLCWTSFSTWQRSRHPWYPFLASRKIIITALIEVEICENTPPDMWSALIMLPVAPSAQYGTIDGLSLDVKQNGESCVTPCDHDHRLFDIHLNTYVLAQRRLVSMPFERTRGLCDTRQNSTKLSICQAEVFFFSLRSNVRASFSLKQWESHQNLGWKMTFANAGVPPYHDKKKRMWEIGVACLGSVFIELVTENLVLRFVICLVFPRNVVPLRGYTFAETLSAPL